MRIECSACNGTGLYSGFAEPEGVAVICSRCSGKGYGHGTVQFTGRKRLKGIHTVWLDSGLWLRRGTKKPSSIKVEEFYAS